MQSSFVSFKVKLKLQRKQKTFFHQFWKETRCLVIWVRLQPLCDPWFERHILYNLPRRQVEQSYFSMPLNFFRKVTQV